MNNTTEQIDDSARFDVREISCREKHARIFQRWNELPVGGYFVLVNDHDPVPLYYQFDAQFPDAFTWEYLERGPEEFQVKITRIRETETPAVGAAPVSGGCGHHHGKAEAASSPLLDVRGLQPPEPMMHIFAALEVLPRGRELRALTDRKPVHLLVELDQRGVQHTSVEQPDGSWLNTLRRG